MKTVFACEFLFVLTNPENHNGFYNRNRNRKKYDSQIKKVFDCTQRADLGSKEEIYGIDDFKNIVRISRRFQAEHSVL